LRRAGALVLLASLAASGGHGEPWLDDQPRLGGRNSVGLRVLRPAVARWRDRPEHAHVLLPGGVGLNLDPGAPDRPQVLVVEGGLEPAQLDLSPKALAEAALRDMGPEVPRVLDLIRARWKMGGDLGLALRDVAAAGQAARIVSTWTELRNSLPEPEAARLFQLHQQVELARQLVESRKLAPVKGAATGRAWPVPGGARRSKLGTPFPARPPPRSWTGKARAFQRAKDGEKLSRGLLRATSVGETETTSEGLVSLGFASKMGVAAAFEFRWPDEAPERGGVGYLSLRLSAVEASQLFTLHHSRGSLLLWPGEARFEPEARPPGVYSVGFPLEVGPRPGDRVRMVLQGLGDSPSTLVQVIWATVYWRPWPKRSPGS
jgi:hypothetical protein